MDPAPEVSVVVPVRDGAATIGALLDALAAQREVRFEVVVVDNGSTDGTAAVVRDHPLEVTLLAEERPGSYAARNAGLAAARAPLLAFTDADCTPEPGWLRAGVDALSRTGADLAGGAVRAVTSAEPTLWERYDRAVYLRQEDLVTHHGWAVTANLFARRSVVDAVGGFDASLPSSGDREWCLRAGRAGHGIVYAADAVVEHRPRRTLRETWRLNTRIGAGMAVLAGRGELPPWWRMREHWMRTDWVVHLMAQDGRPVRRRQVLPVHGLAMAARLYGRLSGRVAGRTRRASTER